jgi:hypothetical protein
MTAPLLCTTAGERTRRIIWALLDKAGADSQVGMSSGKKTTK